jgi:hypothetical protein
MNDFIVRSPSSTIMLYDTFYIAICHIMTLACEWPTAPREEGRAMRLLLSLHPGTSTPRGQELPGSAPADAVVLQCGTFRQLLISVENRRESEHHPNWAAKSDHTLHVDHNKALDTAQGHYGAMAKFESLYATAQLVRQVSLCSDIGLRDGGVRLTMLAIVVPTPLALAEYGNTPTLKRILYQSVAQIAATVGLQLYEVSVEVQAEPFTR